MKTISGRVALMLVGGVIAVGALAGCTNGGVETGPPPSVSQVPHVSHTSKADQQAFSDAQAQADAEHATAEPTAVATDTIQSWPAADQGSRAHATGAATKTSPGVYSYTVQPDDVSSVIALRFGLCDVDIVDTATPNRDVQPGDRLTVERRMTAPDLNEHDEDHEDEGWRCNYPG